MKQGQVRILALDIGGVLATVDKAALHKTLGVSEQRVERAFFADGRHRELALGRLPPGVFLAAAASALGISTAAARAAWTSMLHVTPGGRALVADAVNAGYRVHLWSNIDPIHLDAVVEALGAAHMPLVVRRTASCMTGTAKPDASFWRSALALGAPHAYVDDDPRCVEAAASAGVRGFVARGADEARRVLMHHGILPSGGQVP